MMRLFDKIYSELTDRTKVLDIPTIGTVLLEKSNRAKHINISVKPEAKIRVAVPLGISFKKDTFIIILPWLMTTV